MTHWQAVQEELYAMYRKALREYVALDFIELIEYDNFMHYFEHYLEQQRSTNER
jgi:hypothetical protein